MPLNARTLLPEATLPTGDAARTLAAAGTPVAVDFSLARPTRADLDSVGAVACGRYISSHDFGSDTKDISLAEAQRYESWGRSWWLYYEDSIGDFRAGRAGGRVKAETALARCDEVFGRHDGPVCYSVDDDARNELGLVGAWFDGIRDVVGDVALVDGYGQYAVVKMLHETGRVARSCQTLAWSGGQWYDGSDRHQYAWVTLPSGAQVDLVRVRAADFGQWGYQRLQEVFMTLSATEEQEILRAARQINGAVAPGQASYSTTVEATLSTVQGLVNLVNARSSALAAGVGDVKTAVLGAVAALPTAGMTDEQRAQLAADIAAAVDGLDKSAVLDALAARLAA